MIFFFTVFPPTVEYKLCLGISKILALHPLLDLCIYKTCRITDFNSY